MSNVKTRPQEYLLLQLKKFRLLWKEPFWPTA